MIEYYGVRTIVTISRGVDRRARGYLMRVGARNRPYGRLYGRQDRREQKRVGEEGKSNWVTD